MLKNKLGTPVAVKTPKPVATDYTAHMVDHTIKPITGMVTTEHKKGGEEGIGPVGESKTIHPGVFTSKNSGMSVTAEGSRTLNLGNYESARVGVTITVPCEPDTLDQAYDWATNWISEQIDAAVKEAKGE